MALPKEVLQPPRSVSLRELFPTAEGHPTSLQLQVLKLSQDIGVPFPVEPNPKYANWWHSLHEVAHWAVKPPWYNRPNAGANTIPLYSTMLQRNTHPEISGLNEVSFYHGGNDIIPNMGMYRNPTPAEDQVRPWTILTLHRMGWEHPFRTILREHKLPSEMRKLGDDGWHKAATAHVWSPVTPAEPERIAVMAQFGINPLIDNFRPEPDGFELPHQSPASPIELRENFDAVLKKYRKKTAILDNPEADKLGEEYWDIYTTWARFVTSDTHPAIFNNLLKRFDAVAARSVSIFQEEWQRLRETVPHQTNRQ